MRIRRKIRERSRSWGRWLVALAALSGGTFLVFGQGETWGKEKPRPLSVQVGERVCQVTEQAGRLVVREEGGAEVKDRLTFIRASFIYLVFRREVAPRLYLLSKLGGKKGKPELVAAGSPFKDFVEVFFQRPALLVAFSEAMLAGGRPPAGLSQMESLSPDFFMSASYLVNHPVEGGRALAQASEARAKKAQARILEIMDQVVNQGQPFTEEMAEALVEETYTSQLSSLAQVLLTKLEKAALPQDYQEAEALSRIKSAENLLSAPRKPEGAFPLAPLALAQVWSALSDPKTGLAQLPALREYTEAMKKLAQDFYRARFQILNDAAALFPGGGRAHPATSIVFILDTSGSMAALLAGENRTKLAAAKEIMNELLALLIGLGVEEDYSLIVFDGCTPELSSSMTKDGRELMGQVEKLAPRGRTPLARALTTAQSLMVDSPHEVSFLILLTDGIEECGTQSDALSAASQIQELAIPLFMPPNTPPEPNPQKKAPAAAKEQSPSPSHKIIFTTIGFLASSNEESLLQDLAQAGGGEYYSARSAKELMEILQYTFFRSVVATTAPARRPLTLVEEPWRPSLGLVLVVALMALDLMLLVVVWLLARQRKKAQRRSLARERE